MTVVETRPQQPSTGTKFGIIDADVHPAMNPVVPEVTRHLPERWRRYVAEYGAVRGGSPGGDRPRHREFASRWDAEPPEGGAPGSNPDFAREQLLDRYDISGAMLNDIGAFQMSGARNQPPELSIAFCTAMNEVRKEQWLARDSRWYASINTPYELPEAAAKEIRRCKEDPEFGDRWKQVIFAPDNNRPPGHPFYWPIYEACEEYGLPIGFHVLSSNRMTASGSPNFYFEEHCDWGAFNWPLVASYIFSGTFDRFPTLKIALVELAWSWAVPLAWRMDHAFRVLGSEVPHLDRLPSEYLADHVWYTTQPMEEPENAKWFDDVLEMFEVSGMRDKLMYSSDYPHWDFDEPAALPRSLSDDQFGRILGGNASALYGIALKPDSGWTRR
jgi:predicted TIM-barrel fold metal-dependent hydrolase